MAGTPPQTSNVAGEGTRRSRATAWSERLRRSVAPVSHIARDIEESVPRVGDQHTGRDRDEQPPNAGENHSALADDTPAHRRRPQRQRQRHRVTHKVGERLLPLEQGNFGRVPAARRPS